MLKSWCTLKCTQFLFIDKIMLHKINEESEQERFYLNKEINDEVYMHGKYKSLSAKYVDKKMV